MRQPRCLRSPEPDRDLLTIAYHVKAQELKRVLPEEVKTILREYVASYPGTWWVQFNKDYDANLTRDLRWEPYVEEQFGEHNLKPEFRAIVEMALNN